jgi:hypothetical protein
MHQLLTFFAAVRPTRSVATGRFLPIARGQVWALTITLVFAFAAVFAAAGQTNPKDKPSPWVAKDWTQWTSDDCTQVEYFSPWSHRVSSIAAGRYGNISTSVELRSALPVRQARLRDSQLQKHYDKMDAAEKRDFDRRYASNFATEVDNTVVVVVTNISDRPPPNANAESGVYAPDQAVQIALSLADGTLVQPIQVAVLQPPSGVNVFGNETEYVFPRAVNGKPLYSSNDSLIGIFLGAPLIVDKKTKKVEIHDFHSSGLALSLNISDLMYKGKLEY